MISYYFSLICFSYSGGSAITPRGGGGDVGTVLWCGGDIYLIIVGVVLVILALFNFFGDTTSKVSATFRLLLAIAYAIAISYAVFKKDARIMAGIMIAAIVLIVFDVISILVSIFGKSTVAQMLVSVFFAVIRILFLLHIFYVANTVRKAYEEEEPEPPA